MDFFLPLFCLRCLGQFVDQIECRPLYHGVILEDGVHAHGSSGAQEIAKGAPACAHVGNAFDTIFGHVHAKGGRVDAFIAADDAEEKACVSTFIENLGLLPFDVGGLHMDQTLEALGLMMIGLAKNGTGNWDIALNIEIG